MYEYGRTGDSGLGTLALGVVVCCRSTDKVLGADCLVTRSLLFVESRKEKEQGNTVGVWESGYE